MVVYIYIYDLTYNPVKVYASEDEDGDNTTTQLSLNAGTGMDRLLEQILDPNECIGASLLPSLSNKCRIGVPKSP